MLSGQFCKIVQSLHGPGVRTRTVCKAGFPFQCIIEMLGDMVRPTTKLHTCEAPCHQCVLHYDGRIRVRRHLISLYESCNWLSIHGLWFQHGRASLLFVFGWNSMAAGSDVGVWFYGHHDCQIVHLWIFFLWSHLEELMYRDIMTTQQDLVARLHVACTSVDTTLLLLAHSSIPLYAQACLDMLDGHFEQLPL
ncbi:uncharacterized protein TNCV_1453621 [Trichonephila clavipes]|nr:uncharacterized protein TNCV_1453621 [Trichonephila clavipes]